MKAFRSILALAFTAAFLLIACDSPSEPGDPPNASNVCDREVCATNSAVKERCETFLENCLTVEDEDECVGGAAAICAA